jgi:hypothetical protein
VLGSLSKRLRSAASTNTVLRFAELQKILELGLPWIMKVNDAGDGAAADLFPIFASFHLPIAIAAAYCERNSNQLNAISKSVEEIRTSFVVYSASSESEDLWRQDTPSCNQLLYGSEEEEEEKTAMNAMIDTALSSDNKAISSLFQFESADSLLTHLLSTTVAGVNGGQPQLLGHLVYNGPLHKKNKSSFTVQQQQQQEELPINQTVSEYLFSALKNIKELILPSTNGFNSCSHIQRSSCINTVNSLQSGRDIDILFSPAHIDAISPSAEHDLTNLEAAVDRVLHGPNEYSQKYHLAQTEGPNYKQNLGIGPYSETVKFSCISSLAKFRDFQLGRADEILDRVRTSRERIHGSTKTLVQAGFGKMKNTFKRAIEGSLVESSQCKLSKVAGTLLDAWFDQALLYFAYLTPPVKMKDVGHNAKKDGQMMLYVGNFLDCVAEHDRWFQNVELNEDEDQNNITMIDEESWSSRSRRECCSFMKENMP